MWSALSASSTPFDVTPVPSLSSVYLRSSTVSLSTQDSHGGGALRDMVMIQAQVELPVTGTHLPYAASVALMWVTWRTACPTAQHSRTSGRSSDGGPPGSGFSTLGTWTTLRRSCGLTSDSWDSSAPVWNVRSHPAEHALPLRPTSPLATWSAGRYRVRLAGQETAMVETFDCEALSTWALLSRLPFYFSVFMCT